MGLMDANPKWAALFRIQYYCRFMNRDYFNSLNKSAIIKSNILYKKSAIEIRVKMEQFVCNSKFIYCISNYLNLKLLQIKYTYNFNHISSILIL